jgi:hypothetical protein
VANLLAGAGLGLTLAGNLFRGPVRPPNPPLVPHASVFVLTTGGPPPDPYLQSAAGQPSIYRSNVQVRVRSDVGAFSAAQTLAEAIKNKLHLATLDLSGVLACFAMESAPIYLGRDDTEHHEFSLNASVWWEY